jgi:hypothetical protein
MDLSETMSTCLRRFRLIQDKVGLSAAIQGYPGGFKVIQDEVDLSTAISTYPGQSGLERNRSAAVPCLTVFLSF